MNLTKASKQKNGEIQTENMTQDQTQKSRKTSRHRAKKTSQKRYVTGIKIYVTEEEKKELILKMGNFDSLSNYIRHVLGFSLNSTGRRRKKVVSALGDLDEFLL